MYVMKVDFVFLISKFQAGCKNLRLVLCGFTEMKILVGRYMHKVYIGQ